ncbi:MAG: gfo/Idh/MocA family oxidoreductase, partial [Planctomycetes bacterium]|nr:gfo/Idh/MocA family oxidoreductase [Planctomycetota bacterium]
MNKRQEETPTAGLTRRRFLGRSVVAAGSINAARSMLGAETRRRGSNAKRSPSETLNIAAVGLGARGLGNVEKCEVANIVALCDVDFKLAATALERYPDAAKYQDFRKMLDKEKAIDAVVVSTPDH